MQFFNSNLAELTHSETVSTFLQQFFLTLNLTIMNLKNPFGKPQAEVDFACVYNL